MSFKTDGDIRFLVVYNYVSLSNPEVKEMIFSVISHLNTLLQCSMSILPPHTCQHMPTHCTSTSTSTPQAAATLNITPPTQTRPHADKPNTNTVCLPSATHPHTGFTLLTGNTIAVHPLSKYIDSFIIVIGKMSRDCVNTHPSAFGLLVGPLIELIWAQLVAQYAYPPPPKFLIQCMSFLHEVLGKSDYRCDTDQKRNDAGFVQVRSIGRRCSLPVVVCDDVVVDVDVFLKARRFMDDFFTDDRVTKLGNALLTQYMILTQEDLQKWQEDPQRYFERCYDNDDE